MKYCIIIRQDWNSSYDGGGEPIRNVETREYETRSFDQAIDILSAELDAPVAELTLEQVKTEFTDGSFDIPEERLVGIQRYYNGRLSILRKAVSDLTGHKDVCCSFKYDIPEDYNHFEVLEDRPAGEFQNEAYLKVVVKNNE